jgi:hypothetical protein
MPSTCFSITIPEALRKRLKAAAESARCSEAQITRIALEIFLNNVSKQPLLFVPNDAPDFKKHAQKKEDE